MKLCFSLSDLLSWVAAVEHHTRIQLGGVDILEGQLWLLFNNNKHLETENKDSV